MTFDDQAEIAGDELVAHVRVVRFRIASGEFQLLSRGEEGVAVGLPDVTLQRVHLRGDGQTRLFVAGLLHFRFQDFRKFIPRSGGIFRVFGLSLVFHDPSIPVRRGYQTRRTGMPR
jgi:hypothetical protein